MARVIKGGGGENRAARPGTRVVVDKGGKKVIERDMYRAKQDAELILQQAKERRQEIIAEGKRAAAQAQEEAMAQGAAEAFASAAQEALTAFRRRAERYAEASDDIRALALEVVRKILGNDADLGPKDTDRILRHGMAQLRARRKLRVQVPEARFADLSYERPNLMKALQSEPDLLLEPTDDVSAGFARVVTEVGGSLCSEDAALDALALAVNVHEPKRASRPEGTQASFARRAPTVDISQSATHARERPQLDASRDNSRADVASASDVQAASSSGLQSTSGPVSAQSGERSASDADEPEVEEPEVEEIEAFDQHSEDSRSGVNVADDETRPLKDRRTLHAAAATVSATKGAAQLIPEGSSRARPLDGPSSIAVKVRAGPPAHLPGPASGDDELDLFTDEKLKQPPAGGKKAR